MQNWLGRGLQQHRHTTRGVGVGFLVSIVEEPVLSCRGSNIYATQQGAEK